VTDYTFYTLAERHGSAVARSVGGLGGPLGPPINNQAGAT